MKKIFYILSLFPLLALAQSTDQNYIKTTTYKGAGATSPVVQVTYFDGLGRPIQQITNGQSSTGKDIVTHMEYDAYGRQAKEFLPYANTTASLNYNPNALPETNAFYNTAAYENTTNPYSEKNFEASPLNRVRKQSAPGTDWALPVLPNDPDHTIRFDYLNNSDNEVRLFTAISSSPGAGQYDITLSNSGYYTAGQLFKNKVKNENWKLSDNNNNTTEEFKDKEGHIILKRTYGISDVNGVAQNAVHDTYYVYDQYGNLTYVIPPKVDTGQAITTAVLEGICYQYKYDDRNRLVAKRLPGKQWEYIVYDRLDRPVATGPAFSPFGDSTVGMTITEYDAFGRVTQTGWKALTVTDANRNTWQTNINAGSNPFALATNDILSKNYYDNYTFTDAPSPVPTTVEGQAVATAVKGLPTGTWLRLITTPTELYGATSYTLYDTKYRPIRSHANNHLGGYTRTDNKLDFIGKTLYTKTFHKRVAADTEIILTDTFTYSAQDRLLLHTQQIGSGAVQLIASNTHDELGQLKSKKVGGVDATGALGLQKVDYTYNIRGWLKKINDTDNLIQGSDPQDLFAFALGYQETTGSKGSYTVAKLYNGNISETLWRTSSDNILRKYGYDYDNLNRLVKATYQKPGGAVSTTNSYNETLAYDKNGNITGLKRTGEYDDADYQLEIDNLVYSYDTNNKNQLMKVFDSTNNPNGFKDDSTGTNDPADDYTYDANGNMTSDANKGIITASGPAIFYNHLNLPVKIIFGTTGRIEYLYNAAGVKLQKTVTVGSTVTTTLYFDGFQYVNNILQFFSHAEGYVNNTVVNGKNIYNYAFHYKDHLGNVRLTYGIDPATQLVTVMEENNYYPFGLKHSNYNITQKEYIRNGGGIVLGPCSSCPKRYQYKYNGKELQDELGLNLYDYGARNYDAAIGRWMNIDPLAENSRKWSPYNYAYNNPIIFVDPDGMQAESSQTANIYYDWDEGGYRTREGEEATGSEALAQISKDGEEDCCGDNISGLAKGLWDGLVELQISMLPGGNLIDMATGGNLFRADVKEKEKNAYYAGVILFALLEPSPGGEANLIKSLATKITKKHGLFKCIECADELLKMFKSKGIKGEILEITTNGNKGMAANIWSDMLQTNISTNGRHKAVLIDHMVYDNLHKNGIKYSEWVKDLFSPTGYTITKIPF